MYIHIFFFVFPFVFYLFFRGCESYFSSCNKLKPLLIMILLTSLITVIIGLISAPILFIKSYKRRAVKTNIKWIENFIITSAKNFAIKQPRLFIVDTAKPIAFAVSLFKPKIFISIGLIELLTKMEVEAVLLHELAHIKNKSSMLKFWSFFTKLFSPFAMFSTFYEELGKEEVLADTTAISVQKTSKHLDLAKKKIDEYLIKS
ncbi:MAG: M48 family metalloprotease [Nanoarchaeota archaeon]